MVAMKSVGWNDTSAVLRNNEISFGFVLGSTCFLCVFFSFCSILCLPAYFLPIGWIDHICLAVLFGRETEKER